MADERTVPLLVDTEFSSTFCSLSPAFLFTYGNASMPRAGFPWKMRGGNVPGFGNDSRFCFLFGKTFPTGIRTSFPDCTLPTENMKLSVMGTGFQIQEVTYI